MTLEPGLVAPRLAEEHPGLGVYCATAEGGGGRSSPAVKERLRELSNRFRGAQAINLRQQPIPWAYRVFFRNIGLDPDVTRTPVEQVVLARMFDGRFESSGVADDAVTLAIAEVGVAMLALDAGSVEGRVGLRLTEGREPLGGRTAPLAEGTIVLADERKVLAVLFGAISADCEVRRRTERTLLVAIQAPGVPEVAVEEALWIASEAISG